MTSQFKVKPKNSKSKKNLKDVHIHRNTSGNLRSSKLLAAQSDDYGQMSQMLLS